MLLSFVMVAFGRCGGGPPALPSDLVEWKLRSEVAALDEGGR